MISSYEDLNLFVHLCVDGNNLRGTINYAKLPLVSEVPHENEANRLSVPFNRSLVQYKTTSSSPSHHTGSNNFLKTFSLSNVLSLGNRNSPKALSEKASADIESKSTNCIETMTITDMEEKDLIPNPTPSSRTEEKEKNESENSEYSDNSYDDSESYNDSDSDSYEEDEESGSEESESSDESSESSNDSSVQQSIHKEPIASEETSEQSEQKVEKSLQQEKSFQKKNEKIQPSQRKQSDVKASRRNSKAIQPDPVRKKSIAEHSVPKNTKESSNNHVEAPTQNSSEQRSNSLQVAKKSSIQPSNSRSTDKHVEWVQSVDPPKSKSAVHLRKKHPHHHHHHHHHHTTSHFDWDIRRFHVRYTSDPLYF